MDYKQTETVEGIVENITYRNDENGYCILELSCEHNRVTVVGTMPLVCVGERLSVHGEYVNHKNYGKQLSVISVERSLPVDKASILRFLSSHSIKGIGPITAEQIVKRFGEQSLKIIEEQPILLSQIRGISEKKALEIGQDFCRQADMRKTLMMLAQYRITAAEALRIYNKLGKNCVQRVRENPYMLCTQDIGIGFLRADEIASALDVDISTEFRNCAGIEYVLRHNLQNGHTCLPADKLALVAAQLLLVEPEQVRRQLDEMIAEGRLVSGQMNSSEFVFLPDMYRAERYCANRIALMLKVPPKEVAIHSSRLEEFENEHGILYDSVQRQAISAALTKGILVLTGGPGTGKTTTLNAIISLLMESGADILLAAPTGRAAKRMSELTGRPAKTLHRLLEVEWGENDSQSFKRNEQNPLACTALVVDELSMLDITLFEAVLRAISVDCRLIMVGDVDQLPSVGAGNVLGDMIESGIVPVVRLTRVFRQAQQSLIVTNAHRIIAGELPEASRRDGDFFVLSKSNPDAAAELVCDLFAKRLHEAYRLNPLVDIQVLCPSRKRACGTMNLNNLLQQRVNPPSASRRELSRHGVILRQGDKVMQVRNNYDAKWQKVGGEEGCGVFNGDIGTLIGVDPVNSRLTVCFDDKTVELSGEQLDDIELAYAVTVHKSQGSEFDCVILPVLDIPSQLCYRNLLYTAVTRAKKLLCIIGSDNDVRRMIANDKKTKRYTAFSRLLELASNGQEGWQ